jgi:hypothetical protein
MKWLFAFQWMCFFPPVLLDCGYWLVIDVLELISKDYFFNFFLVLSDLFYWIFTNKCHCDLQDLSWELHG